MRQIKRSNQLLSDWENCLREGTPLFESWTKADIQKMMNAISAIDRDDPTLPMLPDEINYVRRLRKLCLRSIEGGNLKRAVRLTGKTFRPLANAIRQDDMKLAEEKSIINRNQTRGAEITNLRYEEAKAEARRIAVEMLEADSARELTKSIIIERCSNELISKRLYSPSSTVLWRDWLKEPPNIIPEYVSRPGRRK